MATVSSGNSGGLHGHVLARSGSQRKLTIQGGRPTSSILTMASSNSHYGLLPKTSVVSNGNSIGRGTVVSKTGKTPQNAAIDNIVGSNLLGQKAGPYRGSSQMLTPAQNYSEALQQMHITQGSKANFAMGNKHNGGGGQVISGLKKSNKLALGKN